MAFNTENAAACWPTSVQENLLKTILIKDKRAYAAWEKWLSCVDFFEDNLGGGSYQLLPLLYRNFLSLGVDDPLLGRLRGLVRNTWTRNLDAVEETLNSLSGPRVHILHRGVLKELNSSGAKVTTRLWRYKPDINGKIYHLVRILRDEGIKAVVSRIKHKLSISKKSSPSAF